MVKRYIHISLVQILGKIFHPKETTSHPILSNCISQHLLLYSPLVVFSQSLGWCTCPWEKSLYYPNLKMLKIKCARLIVRTWKNIHETKAVPGNKDRRECYLVLQRNYVNFSLLELCKLCSTCFIQCGWCRNLFWILLIPQDNL
jgi:hypothetical protein